MRSSKAAQGQIKAISFIWLVFLSNKFEWARGSRWGQKQTQRIWCI